MKNAKAWRDGVRPSTSGLLLEGRGPRDRAESLRLRFIGSFLVPMKSQTVTNFVCEDHTTQIDVILTREPDSNLLVFHKGTDKNLHVERNRAGEVVKENIDIK